MFHVSTKKQQSALLLQVFNYLDTLGQKGGFSAPRDDRQMLSPRVAPYLLV